MSIDAGQRPFSAAPRVGATTPSGMGSAAEEDLFWRAIHATYPDESIDGEPAGPRDPLGPPDPYLALAWGRVEPEAVRELEPSGLLLDTLDALGAEELDDLDRFDDLTVLEVVAAWQRLASTAAAGAARAAAALSRRACVQVPEGPVPVGRGHRRYSTLRATGTEIAIRTGCTVRSGELLARDGRLFEGLLSATGSALARGQIDLRKARALANRLVDLPMETALDVQAAVLPGAGLRSPAQVDRDLGRALAALDTAESTARHRRARDTRRVCHPTVLPDGMAGIWAVLPAESAALLDATLDGAAASARAGGDSRTVDQLRADGLVDLVLGQEVGDMLGDGLGFQDGLRGRRDVGVGTPRPARAGAAVHVDVTVALSTLLGLDDAPGELAGYGAITAEQAAALAAGGALRRIVTDPLTGAVLDVGRTRYRPPAALREHVIARDRTCARPGCTVPARRAEIDHTIPFGPAALRASSGRQQPSRGSPQGETRVDNLAPLCAPDHLAKSLGVLRLEQPSAGVLEWTTATGLRVRVVPGRDGEVTLLPRAPRQRSGPARHSTPARGDDAQDRAPRADAHRTRARPRSRLPDLQRRRRGRGVGGRRSSCATRAQARASSAWATGRAATISTGGRCLAGSVIGRQGSRLCSKAVISGSC